MASVDAFKVRAIIEAGYDKSSLNKATADVPASYQKMSSKMKQINAVAKSTQTAVSVMGAAIVGSFAAGVAAAAAFEEQFVAVKKTLDVKGSAKETEKAFENIFEKCNFDCVAPFKPRRACFPENEQSKNDKKSPVSLY